NINLSLFPVKLQNLYTLGLSYAIDFPYTLLLRKTVFTKNKFFQIYGVNVIYAFYGVNAHENNHVFFDVLFNFFCFSSKLLNEIKSSNRASLEQT
ncbi:hypothetical protein BpHYR1_009297, partial [Brachionus plicatilis]